jgi:hypothetical protein
MKLRYFGALNLLAEISNDDGLGRDEIQRLLDNRWWYEKCEYHWWNLSACFCRLSGGAFEISGYICFVLANGGIAVIQVLDIDPTAKSVTTAILAGLNFGAIILPKMFKRSFEMSNEREEFSESVLHGRRINPDALNVNMLAAQQARDGSAV